MHHWTCPLFCWSATGLVPCSVGPPLDMSLAPSIHHWTCPALGGGDEHDAEKSISSSKGRACPLVAGGGGWACALLAARGGHVHWSGGAEGMSTGRNHRRAHPGPPVSAPAPVGRGAAGA